MYRSYIPDDTGMLFVFRDPREQNFWMRNTRIPLDILYLADDGRIRNAHPDMAPLRDEPSYPSIAPVRFALELPGGWLKRHGVWLKDRVTLPDALLHRESEEDDLVLGNIPVFLGDDAGS